MTVYFPGVIINYIYCLSSRDAKGFEEFATLRFFSKFRGVKFLKPDLVVVNIDCLSHDAPGVVNASAFHTIHGVFSDLGPWLVNKWVISTWFQIEGEFFQVLLIVGFLYCNPSKIQMMICDLRKIFSKPGKPCPSTRKSMDLNETHGGKTSRRCLWRRLWPRQITPFEFLCFMLTMLAAKCLQVGG